MKKMLVLLMGLMAVAAWGAYLENVPLSFVQPDGSVVECLVTGDEFYHWVHDEEGYVLLRDKGGYLVYAEKVDGKVVPTAYRVGGPHPATLGLVPGILPDASVLDEARSARGMMPQPDAPKTGTLNNLVVFIRFSDQSEYTDLGSVYDGLFNTSATSMKNYFLEASYGALTISSTFYPPQPGSTVVSYQDSHPRAYYSPYNASTNPIGYDDGSADPTKRSTYREHTLLVNAVNFIAASVPAGLVIDGDSDGRVDNTCFIIQGPTDAWGQLLWPHRWSLYSQTVNINGKRVYDYNFQLSQAMASSSVLCHEMFHSLGAPDLYRYSSCGYPEPVGGWDLMAGNRTPPQHMNAQMKMRYGTWIPSIPKITAPGTYTLNPITSNTNNAYRIDSPNSTTQHFILQYRQKAGTFETSLPGSGIVVTRVDASFSGDTGCSPPDELYVYRPDGTYTNGGTIDSGYFSADVGRTAINDATNPSSFLQPDPSGGPANGGDPGGLNIYDISSAGATISFKVGLCQPPSLAPQNAAFYSPGGSGSIAITCGSSCQWIAESTQSWLTITSATSGTGNATLTYTVAANGGASVRNAAIKVLGAVFPVLQGGTSVPGTAPGDATQGLKVTKASNQALTMLYDDGSANSALGYGGNTKALWAQRFTPGIYPFQLTTVSMATFHTSVAVGRPVQIVIYLDASGGGTPNGAGVTLAYTENVTIQVVSSTVFNQYTLTTPVTVTAGDVYVGFYDYLDSDGVSTYIMAYDTMAPLDGRSWYKANSTAPGGFTQMTSGDFMIRAAGTAYPTVKLVWGQPCNSGTVTGQTYALYGKPISQLAAEGYNPSPMDCALTANEKYMDPSGDYYFVIVPLKDGLEGGHGAGATGRTTATSHCGIPLADPSCP